LHLNSIMWVSSAELSVYFIKGVKLSQI